MRLREEVHCRMTFELPTERSGKADSGQGLAAALPPPIEDHFIHLLAHRFQVGQGREIGKAGVQGADAIGVIAGAIQRCRVVHGRRLPHHEAFSAGKKNVR
jgi:hypothetical protein